MTKTTMSVGSSTETLKDRFGPQKVPLASHFSDLIDVADVGRKAVGLSPDQLPGQGQGLQLDEHLKLAVLPQPAGGLNVNGTGVGITVEADKGLVLGAAGLALQAGSGISVGGMGVDVKLRPNKGLSITAEGLAIRAGSGINLTKAGVGITTEAGMGLVVGANGLAVQPGDGIQLGDMGVGVKVEANKGLSVGVNGLAIQPGNGISVDTAGIGVTANATRAIVVGSGGVGVNYDSTLQVTNNQLGVSTSAFQRRTLSTDLMTSTTVWKQIMRVGPRFTTAQEDSKEQAYAQVYIVATGGQRFVLTLCAEPNTSRSNPFSLSLSNVYRGGTYSIGSIRVGTDEKGGVCVDVEVTLTGKRVDLFMYYSVFDTQWVQLLPFSDLTYEGERARRDKGGVIATNSNGSIQGIIKGW
ncbi:hypothetical protein FGA82_22055 [Pseudomonas fluorescens]|uniref:hypothetical protein n=1 Tax=Pseudomonas fluorescens TaxID=294 RepID=UPI001130F33D|nr:hypothetical protein [Pseudomonas fluorescens]TMU73955.1 hypothetical protein FGA82_22055 [Pseudomonas fluorescens]